MSSLVINGDTSGSITLAAPAVAGSNTLTLPTLTGTVLTNKTAGTVLQVVQATTTNYASTTSGTFTDTNLSATITPSSSSSKILVLVTQSIYVDNGGADNGGSTQIVRNSTGVFGSGNSNSFYINAAAVSATALVMYVGMNYLDSPATTSATTYKTQMRAENSSTIIAQVNNNTSSITLLEIAA